ncbi:MAP kinase Pmk1 [Coelomomyces lativittatus]|nr:MAP kinase Pmk1 [Coelomomyces lativittatus]KAJ1507721.1 MAP kinase Pmk1 [Coelomomyces lativittatus]
MATTNVIDPSSFEIGNEYQIQEVIGKGAYGVVCSAIHKASGRRVAIKRIAPFQHPLYSLRTLREIKILRYFDHENIISILDIIRPTSMETFHEVYLIQGI